MNPRMLPRFMALLGKLAVEFKVLDNPNDMPISLTPEELDIMRMAITEYNFYHAHERKETPNPDIDSVKKQVVSEAGKRAVLGLKATR